MITRFPKSLFLFRRRPLFFSSFEPIFGLLSAEEGKNFVLLFRFHCTAPGLSIYVSPNKGVCVGEEKGLTASLSSILAFGASELSDPLLHRRGS